MGSIEQDIRKTSLIHICVFGALGLLTGINPCIDASGQFGGILLGFAMGCIYFAHHNEKLVVRKRLPKVGIAFVLVYFALLWPLLYWASTVFNKHHNLETDDVIRIDDTTPSPLFSTP